MLSAAAAIFAILPDAAPDVRDDPGDSALGLVVPDYWYGVKDMSFEANTNMSFISADPVTYQWLSADPGFGVDLYQFPSHISGEYHANITVYGTSTISGLFTLEVSAKQFMQPPLPPGGLPTITKIVEILILDDIYLVSYQDIFVSGTIIDTYGVDNPFEMNFPPGAGWIGLDPYSYEAKYGSLYDVTWMTEYPIVVPEVDEPTPFPLAVSFSVRGLLDVIVVWLDVTFVPEGWTGGGDGGDGGDGGNGGNGGNGEGSEESEYPFPWFVLISVIIIGGVMAALLGYKGIGIVLIIVGTLLLVQIYLYDFFEIIKEWWKNEL